MVTSNDDRQEFPDEIPTSSKKAKHFFSLKPCRISSIQFPEELLYEVFLRLPVRSLLRFRSVSKGMRRLIDSSVFIENHNIYRSVKISERAAAAGSLSVETLSSDDDEEEYAVLLYRLYRGRLRRFYSLNFENNDNLNRGKAIELNCNLEEEGTHLDGWGCNGIFGFFGLDPQRFVFWNPSNSTFRKVDCSSFKTFQNITMGYDIVNDDYKIIGFVTKDGSSMQVYSLRNDSWNNLSHKNVPSGRACSGSGVTKAVCVGGIMHWMWTTGKHGDVKSIFIIAFNLATETFTSSLPLPSEPRHLGLLPRYFTNFKGRLCITFFPQPQYLSKPDSPHPIWVMQKYGDESSWSKLYNFNIYTFHSVPSYYFPNSRGRLLSHNDHLSWWDPQEGTFERIEIPGLSDACARVYVRNLIRLDQSLV